MNYPEASFGEITPYWEIIVIVINTFRFPASESTGRVIKGTI